MWTRNAVAIASVVAAAISVGAAQPPVSAGAEEAMAVEAPSQGRSSPFVEGDIFPDLAFPSLEDGAPNRLSDFRGRKVMLHVFASW